MTGHLIEQYLTDLGEIRGTRAHVPETSFYPALEQLLSGIGKSLSPKVRCVINWANRGAGIPDGGRTAPSSSRPLMKDTPSSTSTNPSCTPSIRPCGRTSACGIPPEEFFRYQVERVDSVLRSELGLADGLADPNVIVLDPCCGTGAYLRAVLRRIVTTLHDRSGDALVANDLKKAAMERVFGFEILPAPFVIAHLQLGLELETLGAPLSDRTDPPERVGVYLTNALTGWEPPREKPKQIAFPGFDDERDAAEKVKQEKPILVILGNPPYNGYAGVAIDEERDLSTAYRTTKHVSGPQGQGLNDLYVRFFRMADRRIVEMDGKGIVSFISNYSWLDGLSFTGMRERYLEVFDRIDIDCLNGDKYKTGKLTPEGEPDPSVFSTDFNREGIQVGTAIATLIRTGADILPPSGQQAGVESCPVRFRHFWGRNKRAELLTDVVQYFEVKPLLEMGLCFVPGQVAAEYVAWPQLLDLLPVSFPSVKTSRDDFLVDVERDRLLARLEQYFDPNVSHDEMRRLAPGVMGNSARFRAEAVRDTLRRRGILKSNVVRYAYRPFETTGTIRDDLKTVAVFQRVDGKPANPEAGDLDLTAGWGHAGKGGVTMPGKGKLIRRDDGACDIYLNETACWRNVPEAVWNYTIGGYQVIKKWLSYREKDLLGRGLTPDEVRYVTEVARRLSALVALRPRLDANYRQTVAATYAWPARSD